MNTCVSWMSRGRSASMWMMAAAIAILPLQALAGPKEDLEKRILTKVERYQKAGAQPSIEGATGMWRNKHRSKDHEYEIAHLALGDVVVTYGIRDDGSRFGLGYGEGGPKSYRGYWAYSCRECCKGHTYWGPGRLDADRKTGEAVITIAGKVIDPDTCERDDEDTTVLYEMKFIHMLEWVPHLPGKLIHIVAAPAVGNQPAQYKASVKIKWDASAKGIHHVTIAGTGGYIVQNSTKLKGEHEYLASRSGNVGFILVAYTRDDKPLHVESLMLNIPPIPGIGR